MTTVALDRSVLACTLPPVELAERTAAFADLNAVALLRHHREELRLELSYAVDACDRVRDLVRREQACCAFLAFDLRETPDAIELSIVAPDMPLSRVDDLLSPFLANTTTAPATAMGCGCATGDGGRCGTAPSPRLPASKAAASAAALATTGALACGVCCVLPFALPATVLAMSGGAIAWFAHARPWMTGAALVAVIGAVLWIATQTIRTRRRPAAATLVIMAGAIVLLAAALAWPRLEPLFVALLGATAS